MVIGDYKINGQLNRFSSNGIWLGLTSKHIQDINIDNSIEGYRRLINFTHNMLQDFINCTSQNSGIGFSTCMSNYYELSRKVGLQGVPSDMIDAFNALSLSIKNVADLSYYEYNYPSYYIVEELKKSMDNLADVLHAIIKLGVNHGVYPPGEIKL